MPEYRDDVREYLEIAVLSVTPKATSGITATPANHARLAELVHRAVPYPMILLLESEQILVLSLAHKRRAQNQTDKVILDGAVVTVTLTADAPSSAVEIAFLQALSLRRQPQTTLNALYQGWIGSLQALLVSRLTGTFNLAGSPEHAARRSQALHDCLRLELQTAALHAQAGKEKQLARQVELNLELMRVKAELIITRQEL